MGKAAIREPLGGGHQVAVSAPGIASAAVVLAHDFERGRVLGVVELESGGHLAVQFRAAVGVEVAVDADEGEATQVLGDLEVAEVEPVVALAPGAAVAGELDVERLFRAAGVGQGLGQVAGVEPGRGSRVARAVGVDAVREGLGATAY